MTKSRRLNHPHLGFHEVAVPAGREWQRRMAGWSVIRVASGCGYWLQDGVHQELATDTLLLLADTVNGSVRASQLGAVVLQYSRVDPARLTGLISLGEQRLLKFAAEHPDMSVQILTRDAVPATRLKHLFTSRNTDHLHFRLQLLEIFVACFGEVLCGTGKSAPMPTADATERLREMLQQMPSADLVNLSFSDLVQMMRCTPRHVSRIFRGIVGVSFREKQAELRLTRSLDLLLATNSKVVDVAFQSGFQSLSLFNFMFKRRFRMSPGQWREKHQRNETGLGGRKRGAVMLSL
jgi:AraC-like DNA-binding protein